MVLDGLDLTGALWDTLASLREHDNEHAGFINGRKFLNKLNCY
jgi:hypothetical protein